MPKKPNSNLLKPESAVEDFLDTLLQESTENLETAKPLRLKSKLLLLPELDVAPEKPDIAEEPAIPRQKKTIIISEQPVQQKNDSPAARINYFDYKFPLQCLMFRVAGIQLSIPLINMGSVLNWGDRLTQLPNAPGWFLGILKHRDNNVKVADTARIMNINRNDQQLSDSKHILVFGDDNWAITCDQLGDVIKLNEEDVKWSKQGSTTLSLGTIKQSLAILLDPDKILNLLNKHEDVKQR